MAKESERYDMDNDEIHHTFFKLVYLFNMYGILGKRFTGVWQRTMANLEVFNFSLVFHEHERYKRVKHLHPEYCIRIQIKHRRGNARRIKPDAEQKIHAVSSALRENFLRFQKETPPAPEHQQVDICFACL